jgi:two-component system response regulator
MTPQAIVLVEDNEDDAELTMMAFADAKIANPVVHLRDGVEALDYLLGRGQYSGAAQPPLPAVVLLDLKLPKVHGLEVLRELRAAPRTQHLPVVVLTSSQDDRDRADAYASHVNSYVRKPVDYDEFVVATRRLGLYWTLTNLSPPRPAGE